MEATEPPTVLFVRSGDEWFVRNQRHWFFASCPDGIYRSYEGSERCIHAIGLSAVDGMFFVDHDYSPYVLMKAEAALTDTADLCGCFAFTLSLSNSCIVTSCTVLDEGPGLAQVTVQLQGIRERLQFWAAKHTAFYYQQWIKEKHPKAKVFWEKQHI